MEKGVRYVCATFELVQFQHSSYSVPATCEFLEEQVQNHRKTILHNNLIIAQRFRALADIYQQINELLPIARIPPEILVRVFSFYAPCC